ncbi:HPr family phosphocarrier protein [Photobacterium profundum]|uniref:HPr family phosphocarrier protein n=1 Tax=Photobacterium profundum TaxID=74109 RepID=UPI000314889F|nr:HPr family phosphocarrier protein [Photobacterium profundum]
MESFDFNITNENGLHTRPGALLVKACKVFSSSVTVTKGERTVNAKSLMKLMGLGICKNDQILVAVEGDDEAEAIVYLHGFLAELKG